MSNDCQSGWVVINTPQDGRPLKGVCFNGTWIQIPEGAPIVQFSFIRDFRQSRLTFKPFPTPGEEQ